MRRSAAAALALLLLVSAVGCAETKVIDGVEYDTFGLIDQEEKRNPDIQYEVSWGNVFWGIVLSETIIAPIYFFGYSLYEPVGKRPEVKGEVPR